MRTDGAMKRFVQRHLVLGRDATAARDLGLVTAPSTTEATTAQVSNVVHSPTEDLAGTAPSGEDIGHKRRRDSSQPEGEPPVQRRRL